VLAGAKGKAEAYQGYDFVFTRLHARYGTSITDDLVFKAADAIAGGREMMGAGGKLEVSAHADSYNNFQGRYAIRHEWTGKIECDKPERGRWGGPPTGDIAYEGVKPALDLAFAPRGKAKLAELVRKDIPEIDVKAAGAAPSTDSSGHSTKPANPTTAEDYKPSKKGGCGCATTGGPAGWLLALAVLGLVIRRKR
jgi:MYXO-CTERM domain-containing protein